MSSFRALYRASFNFPIFGYKVDVEASAVEALVKNPLQQAAKRKFTVVQRAL